MIHYHGTPISPVDVLYKLAGNFFCVSHADPRDVDRCHQIGQGVMLDNGAYSAWTRGHGVDFGAYLAWCEPWLADPNTWAVVPDVIDGGEEENDVLCHQWPRHLWAKAAPVWHMHESLARLLNLIEHWPRVCIGSSGEFADVMSTAWQRRCDKAWNTIAREHKLTPAIHMLRGMQCAGERWPFASVDSSDIARHHCRPHNGAKAMADRWNAVQCPGSWQERELQHALQI